MLRRLDVLFLMLGLGLVGMTQAQVPVQSITGNKIACAGGIASAFPCGSVDLSAFLTTADVGGQFLNDIWGWTDPQTGNEYALVGRSDGVAFVDVTNPVGPLFLGTLRSHDGIVSIWRDMKVYDDHMFVVVDGAGSHGMQVFDLTQLRGIANPPVLFTETAHYDGVAQAHNIAINEETGFAYIVGAGNGGITCGGGLHMVNIQEPTEPSFAGCYADPFTGRIGTGYTHDVQCVVYNGPDTDHQGREVCFGANETAITIADVTDKDDPTPIARALYPNVGYAHQGWLTEDHRYFLLDDELDELRFEVAVRSTRTLIWDLTDLDDPVLLKEHAGESRSIDHNLYVVGDHVFQANYTSGLRILNIADINNPKEVAFFDTVPGGDQQQFAGAWSVYPFFESGTIIVSSSREGLFIVEPTNLRVVTATEPAEVPGQFALSAAHPNPFNPQTTFTLTLAQAQRVRVAAYDMLGREVAVLHDGTLSAGAHPLTFEAVGLPSGADLVQAVGATAAQTQVVTLAK